jgi:hypothetical protein
MSQSLSLTAVVARRPLGSSPGRCGQSAVLLGVMLPLWVLGVLLFAPLAHADVPDPSNASAGISVPAGPDGISQTATTISAAVNAGGQPSGGAAASPPAPAATAQEIAHSNPLPTPAPAADPAPTTAGGTQGPSHSVHSQNSPPASAADVAIAPPGTRTQGDGTEGTAAPNPTGNDHAGVGTLPAGGQSGDSIPRAVGGMTSGGAAGQDQGTHPTAPLATSSVTGNGPAVAAAGGPAAASQPNPVQTGSVAPAGDPAASFATAVPVTVPSASFSSPGPPTSTPITTVGSDGLWQEALNALGAALGAAASHSGLPAPPAPTPPPTGQLDPQALLAYFASLLPPAPQAPAEVASPSPSTGGPSASGGAIVPDPGLVWPVSIMPSISIPAVLTTLTLPSLPSIAFPELPRPATITPLWQMPSLSLGLPAVLSGGFPFTSGQPSGSRLPPLHAGATSPGPSPRPTATPGRAPTDRTALHGSPYSTALTRIPLIPAPGESRRPSSRVSPPGGSSPPPTLLPGGPSSGSSASPGSSGATGTFLLALCSALLATSAGIWRRLGLAGPRWPNSLRSRRLERPG